VVAGAADGEVLDPGQGAAGGFEVQHHLLNRSAEAAVQADPVVEHALGHERIGPGLELQVQDRCLGSIAAGRQQDDRIGVQGLAAEFPIEQLPIRSATGGAGRLLTGLRCWNSSREPQQPAADAGGVASHQLFAEVVDHRPAAPFSPVPPMGGFVSAAPPEGFVDESQGRCGHGNAGGGSSASMEITKASARSFQLERWRFCRSG
jgi:hypothetical protein